MKEYNLKQSAVIVVVGLAILWMCLYAFVFPFLTGGGPEKVPRVRSDEKVLQLSLEAYHQDFGVYPAGENSNIVSTLAGNNSRKIVFLNFRRSTEHSNEMVDPWETPYKIDFLRPTNFIIRSAGQNKIFGDKDDIIFNSISNGFVKP